MSKNKNLSRRDFLKTAGVIGAGSLVSASGASAQAPAGSDEKKDGKQTVPTRPFGKTGIEVSCLSLGGMFDIPSNQLLMRQVLNYGVTYWDTADCYEGGKSESGIGQVFSKMPEVRKKIFLVTKSDARDPEGMTKLLNRSLERLKTDYIDLYFIHGMSNMNELTDDTKAWAEKAKSQGKIKLFGFSTHKNMEELLLGAAKLGWVDGIMMTYNYRIMNSDKMKAAVDACTKAGIGLTAMKTMGGGPVRVDSEAELEMAGKFMQKGFTEQQAKLKAVWANPNIACICSQMPNMSILMSNIAAALDQTKLSAEDMRLLDRYAEETSCGYCVGCAHICESAMAGLAPVGDVMRYLMYYHSYGDRDRARAHFAELAPEVRDRLASLDFSDAERRCPQKLQIGKLMKEAATILA
jgi:predicted aldo/keto reductase-like oxidoreductase